MLLLPPQGLKVDGVPVRIIGLPGLNDHRFFDRPSRNFGLFQGAVFNFFEHAFRTCENKESLLFQFIKLRCRHSRGDTTG